LKATSIESHILKFLFPLVLILFFLVPRGMKGQSTWINTLSVNSTNFRGQMEPTADGGFAILQTDSAIMHRFSSCGGLQWIKKYRLPEFSTWGTFEGFIVPKAGGFLWVNRIFVDGMYQLVLTRLNDQGEFVYSRRFKDVLYEPIPYSLKEDQQGNFWVFGNASPLGGGTVFGSIWKINPQGNLLWNKFYSGDPTWGSALVTKEGGCLFRKWNSVVKVDGDGNVLWSRKYDYNQLGGTYLISHILEVEDGYILNELTRWGESKLFKINKEGHLVPLSTRRFKTVIFPGRPTLASNGNVVLSYLNYANSLRTTGLLELDKDLNQIKAIKSKSIINWNQLYHNGLSTSSDGSVFYWGFLEDSLNGPSVLMAKGSADLEFPCDSASNLFKDTILTSTEADFSTSPETRSITQFEYSLPAPISL
jgi:hypothetical protein